MNFSEPITVVIVDQDLEAREQLARVLNSSGIGVTATAGYGVAATTAVQRTQPSCILLSLEGSAVRGFQTMSALATVAEDLPIIAYSTQLDTSSMRRAMLAGAQDYLPAPLDPDMVWASIRDLLEQRAARLRLRSAAQAEPAVGGTVITIYGAKGGIGKSTLAINLSVALSWETDASVVLVDTDTTFGDVAIMLDVHDESPIQRAIRDIDKLNAENIRDYLFHFSSGFSFLPALRNPSKWNIIQPQHMSRIIEILRGVYDYVILDTPGTYNESVIVALEAADLVLLMSSLDMSSLKDTKMVLDIFPSHELSEGNLKLVLCHSSLADDISAEVVARSLDCEVFWEIPFDREVNRSGQRGEPIVLSNPRSKVGRSITELARTIGGMQARVPDRPAARRRSGGPFAALGDLFRRGKGRDRAGRAASLSPSQRQS